MGLPQQSFGAGLEHGPVALFDLCLPASQLGKEIIVVYQRHPLTHRSAVLQHPTTDGGRD